MLEVGSVRSSVVEIKVTNTRAATLHLDDHLELAGIALRWSHAERMELCFNNRCHQSARARLIRSRTLDASAVTVRRLEVMDADQHSKEKVDD